MTRSLVCASLVAQTELGASSLIICPGLSKLYAVAVVTDDGGFERVSEHDTPEAACDAKDHARAAAADAVIALGEIVRERAA